MEQVLQCYGKGIAAGIVLIAVMVLLFAGIRDEQGNRGIINIIKTWIPEEETITENAAIDAFAEAGDVEGIYTVRVCATDEANRRSVCEFQIPVNR